MKKSSCLLPGSTIAKITLSKILKMPIEKYLAYNERKINGKFRQKEKLPAYYARVVPIKGKAGLPSKGSAQADGYGAEIADERLLRQYPISGLENRAVVVKMINTRNAFSEHIVRGILMFQSKFWETGKASDIRPLTLKQFLSLYPCPGLDESRLSRLVSAVPLQTKGGRIYNLKKLFISMRRFHAYAIRGIIDESDQTLSDGDIQAIILKRRGIRLSVRTVCECRKLLSIPNFRERRSSYHPKDISFSQPVALVSKTVRRMPDESGVYELLASSKLQYPKCSSPVIYIGCSNKLRRRAANYSGKAVKNKRIAEFLGKGVVRIRYHVTLDYMTYEKELLRHFKRRYGQLPQGNIIGVKL